MKTLMTTIKMSMMMMNESLLKNVCAAFYCCDTYRVAKKLVKIQISPNFEATILQFYTYTIVHYC